MTLHTGHIADHPAVVATRLGFHLHPQVGAMKAGTLPLQTTNRMTVPTAKGGSGILDQKDTETCEAHAHAAGMTLFWALLGAALADPASPVSIAYGMYTVDETPNADGSLPGLFDVGSMPSSAQTALQVWGAGGTKAFGQYPASTQTMYQNPNDPAQVQAGGPLIACPPEKWALARVGRVAGAYFIQSRGPAKVLAIMQALAAKYPVSVALPASGSVFQGYKGGVLTDLSGPVDHANLFIDYQWSGTQAQLDSFVAAVGSGDMSTATALMASYLQFIDQNSWSESWGIPLDVPGLSGGFCLIGPQVVANDQELQDPCVLDYARVT